METHRNLLKEWMTFKGNISHETELSCLNEFYREEEFGFCDNA